MTSESEKETDEGEQIPECGHEDGHAWVSEAIARLEAAGWIKQVEEDDQPIRGLYKFVGDPREDDQ